MAANVSSSSNGTWYSVSNYYANQAAQKTTTPNKDLDKNAFLQILVTQLQNQDPTDPMKNQDFIAQMAQFSSLEQMNNVATQMQQVSLSNSLGTAVGLIGKTVTALDANGNPVNGVVSGMSMVNGKANVQIGSTTLDIANIESVS